MQTTIDLDSILAPIEGDNPAGQDLKYEPIYDEIKEAKRVDDLGGYDSDEGLKTANWPKAVSLCVDALTEQTKDLQLAVWLTEGLIHTDGFEGAVNGLKIISGLLENFWEAFYPVIEDDDLDYRVGPLEYLNNRVVNALKMVSITDKNLSTVYSYLQYEESKLVAAAGSSRQDLINEGKVSPEDFSDCMSRSSLAHFQSLDTLLADLVEEFQRIDALVDDKFGQEAPRLSDFGQILEDSKSLTERSLRQKTGGVDEEGEDSVDVEEGEITATNDSANNATDQKHSWGKEFEVFRLLGQGGREDLLWQEATKKMKTLGLKDSLEMLTAAAYSAQSVRERTNYRILMAKICLLADRPDLATPITEEIFDLVDKYDLQKWESPAWTAEVAETLYQCAVQSPDFNPRDHRDLLKKIVTQDVTKAIQFKGEG